MGATMSSGASLPTAAPQGSNPWNAINPATGQPMYSARNFFAYEADTLPSYPAGLAAGAAAQISFNIAGDSDFFWTKFTGIAFTTGNEAGSLTSIPAVSLLLTNTTTGRQYSSNAVPIASMMGSGQLPFILPQITLWQKKSTIQIQLQNLSSDTLYTNVQLTFLGIKAFTNS